MSKGNNRRFGQGELTTIIGPDASLEGRLEQKNSMRIDGKIRGELASQETITIGGGGSVEGDITAKDVVLGGKVTGKVTASNKVVLEGNSILQGDLKTSRLVVEEGAKFNGRSDMGSESQSVVTHKPQKINLTED